MSPRLLSLAALALLIASQGVRAQSDFPNTTVRIVVDSAAGSANDSTSRVLGDRLSKVWNQPVVTLNQPGAGGGISAKVASLALPAAESTMIRTDLFG